MRRLGLLALLGPLAAACSGPGAPLLGTSPAPVEAAVRDRGPAPEAVAAGPRDGSPSAGSASAPPPPPPPLPTRDRISVVTVTDGLERPWAMEFLPDGSLLVTEKAGRIRPVSTDGRIGDGLRGVPRVATRSQGGLLDITLSPDFTNDRLVYLSYSQPLDNGRSRTVVARAPLNDGRLGKIETLYRQHPSVTGGLHFGSRLVFGRDGLLYVTLGERNQRDDAQALDNGLGKVLRLEPDGGIPADNPFVSLGKKKADPAVYSYGHRNPQGAALHPETGALWVVEHGPQGGDEINLVREGANYGWPRITYGREYGSGAIIGEDTKAAEVEPPRFYWVPFSIGPSSMLFYTGDAVPALSGSLLVGALSGRTLVRLTLDGDRIVGEERLLEDLGERIRDVAQGPDGHPYLLTDSGKLLRIDARRGPND